MTAEEETKEFEEFSVDCPKRHFERDRQCTFCRYNSCLCEIKECMPFYGYKKTLEKLKGDK